jgi:hypothetical protein
MSTFKEHNAVGCFQHRETKAIFEFRPTKSEWAFDHNLDYEIAVGDGFGFGYRYAKILQTVAYVAVDENDSGPVIEKWAIKMWWRKE